MNVGDAKRALAALGPAALRAARVAEQSGKARPTLLMWLNQVIASSKLTAAAGADPAPAAVEPSVKVCCCDSPASSGSQARRPLSRLRENDPSGLTPPGKRPGPVPVLPLPSLPQRQPGPEEVMVACNSGGTTGTEEAAQRPAQQLGTGGGTGLSNDAKQRIAANRAAAVAKRAAAAQRRVAADAVVGRAEAAAQRPTPQRAPLSPPPPLPADLSASYAPHWGEEPILEVGPGGFIREAETEAEAEAPLGVGGSLLGETVAAAMDSGGGLLVVCRGADPCAGPRLIHPLRWDAVGPPQPGSRFWALCQRSGEEEAFLLSWLLQARPFDDALRRRLEALAAADGVGCGS